MSKFLIFPSILQFILNFRAGGENIFYNLLLSRLGIVANSQNFAKFR